MEALSILFGASFTVLTAAALGAALFGGVVKDWPARFIAGAAVLHLIVMALCCFGWAYPAVFGAVGVAALLAGRRAIFSPREAPAAGTRVTARYIALAMVPFFLMYCVNAIAPEVSPDGSGYHLGFVARYLREHGFHVVTWSVFASLSKGAEMLFLFAFAFGRHSAAAMVHFAFLIALVWQVAIYGRHAGFPVAGICAAALVFTSPVVGIDGISAYNDVALAACGFTLFCLLEQWNERQDPKLLIAIGAVAGFGFAVKYSGWVGVVYALVRIGWRKGAWPVRWRRLAAAGAAAAAMAAPWLIKNWLWVGNPFSPFLNGVFPNPYVTTAFEAAYWHNMRIFPSLLALTTTATPGDGILGPVFLLAPLALLALRKIEGRRLLFAAAVFGVNYLSAAGARYLIPTLPFVALAMCLAFGSGRAGRVFAITLTLSQALLAWPPVLRHYTNERVWRLVKTLPYREALRIKPAEPFLLTQLPEYALDRMIERFTAPGATVFTYHAIPEAYTSRRILTNFEAAENEIDGLTLWTGFQNDWRPIWRVRFPFPAQSLSGFRIVQSNTAQTQWRITEVRAFDGAVELPRTQWRVTAKPFPWGAERAFDNNPVTFWECGDLLGPGYMEARFPAPQRADSVLLEAVANNPDLILRLDGLDSSGAWKPIAQPHIYNAEPTDLRRAAVIELERRRIGYLLLFPEDVAAEDVRRNAELWGVRQVAETDGVRLYQLQ